MESGRLVLILAAVAAALFLRPALSSVIFTLLGLQAALGFARLFQVRKLLGFPVLGPFLRILAAGVAAYLCMERELPMLFSGGVMAIGFAALGGVRISDFREARFAIRGRALSPDL
jgi:hypothetical protein